MIFNRIMATETGLTGLLFEKGFLLNFYLDNQQSRSLRFLG